MGRVVVCTTLSAGAAGITSLVLVHYRSRTWDMLSMCTGALGGEFRDVYRVVLPTCAVLLLHRARLGQA